MQILNRQTDKQDFEGCFAAIEIRIKGEIEWKNP